MDLLQFLITECLYCFIKTYDSYFMRLFDLLHTTQRLCVGERTRSYYLLGATFNAELYVLSLVDSFICVFDKSIAGMRSSRCVK